MLASLLTETVSVKRDGAISGQGDQLGFATVIASLPCHIQPEDEDTFQDIPHSFGKTWLLLCDPADVREGDRITWDGKEYRVMTSISHDFAGEEHTEVRMRAAD